MISAHRAPVANAPQTNSQPDPTIDEIVQRACLNSTKSPTFRRFVKRFFAQK